jgi:aspartate 1-decarboxylase
MKVRRLNQTFSDTFHTLGICNASCSNPKIHRATVTEADLDYEGSVKIDEDLMRAGNIVPYEQVHIYDVTNGNRIITYAMIGAAGSGTICINGAAAHKVHPGDLVILATYSLMSEDEQRGFQPKIVQVDAKNRAL